MPNGILAIDRALSSLCKNSGFILEPEPGESGESNKPVKGKEFLEGKLFSEQTMTEAGDVLTHHFNPMTDVRATRHYRLTTCKNLLQRLWLEQSGTTATRVSHAAL